MIVIVKDGVGRTVTIVEAVKEAHYRNGKLFLNMGPGVEGPEFEVEGNACVLTEAGAHIGNIVPNVGWVLGALTMPAGRVTEGPHFTG